MSSRSARRATLTETRCPHCSATVLEGVTGVGSAGGLTVTIDPAALTAIQELAARVAGISTYTWHRVADELHHRYPAKIRAAPAGTARQTVHPAHHCHHAWTQGDHQPAQPAPAALTDLPPY